MSCANKSCFRNVAKTIKFDKLPCTAHVVAQSELDSPFAIVNLDGAIFMELSICPIEGSGFTALFEVISIDGGFGVIVPDYVADINEKLLSDLAIVPIIADDPEVEDDDDDDDEGEAEDEGVVSDEGSDEGSDDADDCEEQDSVDIQKLLAFDKDAKRMVTRALRTDAGKDLFRSFATAKTADEEIYWLDKLLDFVLWLDTQDGEHSHDDCGKTAAQGVTRAEDFVKTFLNGLAAVTSFAGCEKSDTHNTAAPKHKCHGCGSCGGSCSSGDKQTEEEADKLAESRKKQRTATRWSAEDVNLLKAAAKKFRDKNGNICWENVAKATGRSAEACRNKYGRLSSLA